MFAVGEEKLYVSVMCEWLRREAIINKRLTVRELRVRRLLLSAALLSK